ncbi:MAG: DNA-directed RNA polymerase subunit D [Candidatus Altiarchaeota archaeon]|nr:DNA-directed RNA polymerase subunit D [Candidatus Altiarchaeota archaeon]
MKLTNYKKQGNIITFTVSGVDVKLLNALRRTIIAGVPSMSVEKVTFYSNTSILNDEVLAHRIGMVPLTTDLKTYTMPAECSCKGKGCAKCTVTLMLDVSGPRTVYSGEMESTDPNVKPVHEKIPLVKLTEKQKLKFEATAQLGLGKDHVKWQSGIAAYEEKEKDTYDFMVESFGQYEPEELLNQALERIGERIKEVKSEVG